DPGGTDHALPTWCWSQAKEDSMRRTCAALTLMVFVLSSTSSFIAPAAAQNYDRYNRGYYRGDRGDRGYYRGVLPAGTVLDVRLDQLISTEDARPGDEWTGTVVNSVNMIPAGTPVSGVVTIASQGTHNSKAELGLA